MKLRNLESSYHIDHGKVKSILMTRVPVDMIQI